MRRTEWTRPVGTFPNRRCSDTAASTATQANADAIGQATARRRVATNPETGAATRAWRLVIGERMGTVWQAFPARQLTGRPYVYHAYVGHERPER